MLKIGIPIKSVTYLTHVTIKRVECYTRGFCKAGNAFPLSVCIARLGPGALSGKCTPPERRPEPGQNPPQLREEANRIFYVIIGQSGGGKTTFAKERFLNGDLTIVQDIIPLTECSNGIVALGRYGVGKRTEGVDLLGQTSRSKFKQQLRKLVERDVLLEGYRVCHNDLLDYISFLGVPTKLYLVTCSLSTSLRRLSEAGANMTPRLVKGTKTKAKWTFLKYCNRFNGEVVFTDDDRRDI